MPVPLHHRESLFDVVGLARLSQLPNKHPQWVIQTGVLWCVSNRESWRLFILTWKQKKVLSWLAPVDEQHLTQPMDPEKRSLNFIFPTKYVIPKSLKFSHWPSKALYCMLYLVSWWLLLIFLPANLEIHQPRSPTKALCCVHVRVDGLSLGHDETHLSNWDKPPSSPRMLLWRGDPHWRHWTCPQPNIWVGRVGWVGKTWDRKNCRETKPKSYDQNQNQNKLRHCSFAVCQSLSSKAKGCTNKSNKSLTLQDKYAKHRSRIGKGARNTQTNTHQSCNHHKQ